MLLDLGLPDSSGALTFQWACPQSASCPVIVLSASEAPPPPDRDGGQLWDLRLPDQGLYIRRSALPGTVIEAIASHARQWGH